MIALNSPIHVPVWSGKPVDSTLLVKKCEGSHSQMILEPTLRL